jgi:HEAT repeat protein
MDVTSYPPPVDKLLTLGDGRKVGTNVKEWSIYLDLGLGPEHIPDLVRMATDEELRWAYSDTLEVWAPIHAWRALGQLRAEAAIEPLLSLLDEAEGDDDWVMEELPEVYGMIGPAAIPAITEYIADDSHLDWARITAIGCLEKIGTMHPDSRDTCVAILTRRLKLCEQDDPTINAFVISSLIDMRALEAAPAIERAFATDCVDLSIAGDWDDVQIELGLKSPVEILQERHSPLFDRSAHSLAEASAVSPGLFSSEPARKRNVAHNKAKRKMIKQSRKKNRRRK